MFVAHKLTWILIYVVALVGHGVEMKRSILRQFEKHCWYLENEGTTARSTRVATEREGGRNTVGGSMEAVGAAAKGWGRQTASSGAASTAATLIINTNI